MEALLLAWELAEKADLDAALYLETRNRQLKVSHGRKDIPTHAEEYDEPAADHKLAAEEEASRTAEEAEAETTLAKEVILAPAADCGR